MRKMQTSVGLISEEEDEKERPRLDWKDYIAFVIALFETALFPILIILGVLILFVVVLWLVKPSSSIVLFTNFLVEGYV
jgi:hypothetical protein